MTLGELRAVNSFDPIRVASAYDGRILARELTKKRHKDKYDVKICGMYLDIYTSKNSHNCVTAIMVCYVLDREWFKENGGKE